MVKILGFAIEFNNRDSFLQGNSGVIASGLE